MQRSCFQESNMQISRSLAWLAVLVAPSLLAEPLAWPVPSRAEITETVEVDGRPAYAVTRSLSVEAVPGQEGRVRVSLTAPRADGTTATSGLAHEWSVTVRDGRPLPPPASDDDAAATGRASTGGAASVAELDAAQWWRVLDGFWRPLLPKPEATSERTLSDPSWGQLVISARRLLDREGRSNSFASYAITAVGVDDALRIGPEFAELLARSHAGHWLLEARSVGLMGDVQALGERKLDDGRPLSATLRMQVRAYVGNREARSVVTRRFHLAWSDGVAGTLEAGVDRPWSETPEPAIVDGARDPSYRRTRAPAYPLEADPAVLATGARVVVRADIDADGRVVSATIGRSSGHAAFDDAALAAVREWTFWAEVRAGEPVATVIQVPVTFAPVEPPAAEPAPRR
jgi:protein TonB